ELRSALAIAERGVAEAKNGVPSMRAYALIILAFANQMNDDRERAIDLLREVQGLSQLRFLFERRLAESFLLKFLKEKGDFAAAEKVLQNALTHRQTALPKGHPEIAASQVNLATDLTDQKKFAEAEPLLLTAYERLNSHPQTNSASLKRRRLETLE